ncbi:DMT family transporter [Aneurinibacillus aneurinilyticus]|uniref:DMT family transporter n=1 Tax=Aneurinibacillus aneurinilyticus TaxID=1391 RepID=A0A848CR60_ANEAE|nr:DMT family transporter [Aneurinibacillus aneurinilyticus]MED0673519.1 DMT family transporter [Aneurinibacillus aneurinilyticus]NME98313.1 DMT family transporter [Aneurinibacillus aneurinilyticus]
MDSKRKKLAYIAALLYAFIIGFSFIFVKLALLAADPLNTLAHRFTVAFLVASIPIVFGWIKLNIKPRDMLLILPLTLFYPTMFFAFQTFGLVYASSSEAGIIQATVPIFTLILATYFLKEHTNRWQKLCIVLSVTGVIYIFTMQGIAIESTNFKGTILILFSTLSVSGYNIVARSLTKKYKLSDLTYMMTAIGFLCFNLFSLIHHAVNGSIHLYFQPFTNMTFLISIVFLGVLSSLITSFLSNYALSQIEASKISVFSNLATFIAIMAGVVFLHEKLAYFHIIGAIMIVLGLLGTTFLDKETKTA